MGVEKTQAASLSEAPACVEFQVNGSGLSKSWCGSHSNDPDFASASRPRGQGVNEIFVRPQRSTYIVKLPYFVYVGNQRIAKNLQRLLHWVGFRTELLTRLMGAPVQTGYHNSCIGFTTF